MTNPTPRPALRKAEDATVHPAAPRPARSPRASTSSGGTAVTASTTTTPVETATGGSAPAPTAPARPAETSAPAKATKAAKPSRPRPAAAAPTGKRKRKFGGATSDHLRVEPEPVPEGVASGTDARASGKPSKARAKESTRDDLMQGKPVDVDVEVPKSLRKAAAKRAKSEGLDLQTVVIDLLHAYVTRPPR